MAVSRRLFLTGTAAAASGAVASGVAMSHGAPSSMDIVTASDARYSRLANRGFNPRFRARPAEILVPHNQRGVVAAVERAVATGARIGLRSGGHCFEDFADSPGVRALIDLGGYGLWDSIRDIGRFHWARQPT